MEVKFRTHGADFIDCMLAAITWHQEFFQYGDAEKKVAVPAMFSGGWS